LERIDENASVCRGVRQLRLFYSLLVDAFQVGRRLCPLFDEEFTSQMSALYEKKQGVQRRLIAIERAKEDFIKLDPEEQVKKYVAELQSEMTKLIHADLQTSEERHQVFMLLALHPIFGVMLWYVVK
jgi:hypothetical protein